MAVFRPDNGEYSGQICLFMPQPENLRDLIFALFFPAFLVASRRRGGVGQ